MPHHYGRSKRSTSTNTRPNPHTKSGTSKSTHVSSGAAQRQKKAVQVSIQKKGADDLTNYKVKQVPIIGPVSLLANTLTGTKLRQLSFEKNREFYRKKVLTSKNVGKYEDTLDSYKSYMKSRMSGETDAYGNPISKGGNGRPVVEKNVGGRTILAQAPTEAEVSQSDAANAAETKLTKRRVKARGRKMNIYTSASGQTKDKLILGKKSLLGMV